MSLVERVTESGLVLYENRQDGAAVARALQREDPRLSLRCDQHGTWRVYFNDQGRDVFILAWVDAEGKPRQLSHDLIEAVRYRDRASRADPADADRLNAALEKQMARERENVIEAIYDDHVPAIKTKRMSRRIKEKPW